jgi:putative permease
MLHGFLTSNFGKVTIVLLVVAVALLIAAQFLSIAILVLIAGVFTFFLSPIVEWFERRRVPRGITILGIFISGFGLIAWMLAMFLPILITDLSMLGSTVQHFPFAERIRGFEEEIRKIIPMIQAGDISSRIQAELTSLISQAMDILSSVASIITFVTIIPFITFFLLKDGPRMQKKFVELIPNRYFEMGLNVLYKIRTQLTQYIRGVILEAVIVGTLVTIGLSMFGIQSAPVLGLISAILNLIPYVGPLISAISAIVVSINQFGGLSMVLPLALMFIGVRFLDDFLLIPYLYSRSVETHPVAVILYIFIGGQLIGIVGMVLAIPVATVVKVIMKETYWGLEHYHLAHRQTS